jgi:hypothetical protein
VAADGVSIRVAERREVMSTELHRDEFGAIIHDQERSALELDWFERTASMTDEDPGLLK